MIQIAIPVPKELENTILQAFMIADTEHTIQTKSLPLEEIDDKDLGFDPASVLYAICIGVKIAGPAAANIAAGVVSGLIANEIFRRIYLEAKGHTLTIRLPDTTTIELPVDKPLSETEVVKLLQNKLEEKS